MSQLIGKVGVDNTLSFWQKQIHIMHMYSKSCNFFKLEMYYTLNMVELGQPSMLFQMLNFGTWKFELEGHFKSKAIT